MTCRFKEFNTIIIAYNLPLHLVKSIIDKFS